MLSCRRILIFPFVDPSEWSSADIGNILACVSKQFDLPPIQSSLLPTSGAQLTSLSRWAPHLKMFTIILLLFREDFCDRVGQAAGQKLFQYIAHLSQNNPGDQNLR